MVFDLVLGLVLVLVLVGRHSGSRLDGSHFMFWGIGLHFYETWIRGKVNLSEILGGANDKQWSQILCVCVCVCVRQRVWAGVGGWMLCLRVHGLCGILRRPNEK